jgi:putative Ca2+/H+ antiporter (TMEM165/GDT1 family)
VKTSTLPYRQPAIQSAQPSVEREPKDRPDAHDTATQIAQPSDKEGTRNDSEQALQLRRGAWRVFASTFFTIFLAEMGDKTQIATLLMAAESHSPWVVFLGAGSALITTSLIGVLLGRWLASRLSPKTLETSAGVILLFISVSLIWDVLH